MKKSKNIPWNIISIDVGLKTLSLCIESYNKDKLNSLEPPTSQYIVSSGESTDDFKNYILDVSKCGSLLCIEKVCLGERRDYFSGKAFQNLYTWLYSLKEKFDTCKLVLIEAQMKNNHVATALMHHINAWFSIIYKGELPVILYPSKNKTRILGMPLNMEQKDGYVCRATYTQRKKWSVQQIETILKERNDLINYNYIFKENKSKKDDLSDTMLQCLSYVVGETMKYLGVKITRTKVKAIKKNNKLKELFNNKLDSNESEVEEQEPIAEKPKRTRKTKAKEPEQITEKPKRTRKTKAKEQIVEEQQPIVEKPKRARKTKTKEPEPIAEEPEPIAEEPEPIVEKPKRTRKTKTKEPIVEEPEPIVEKPKRTRKTKTKEPIVEEPEPIVEKPKRYKKIIKN